MIADTHGGQDTVLVEQQAGYGPHGYPIYADAERTVRARSRKTVWSTSSPSSAAPEPDTPCTASPCAEVDATTEPPSSRSRAVTPSQADSRRSGTAHSRPATAR
ncbi:DUF6296 family protein [Kitasatospora sp. NPDC050463]|uniref:DUF6296 family protein n=1 Tax=Kitasatospora sp. NPDC050463 TaxID=3155786 RepID=UPI0033E5B5BC